MLLKNEKLKKIICAVVFLAFAVLMFLRISEICRFSSWSYTAYGYLKYSKLKNLESYPIDVVAIGSSVCNRSFVPSELYKQYGISAYNIGGNWQPPMTSYFLLKELLKSEKPKIVLLEAYRLGYPAEGEEVYRVVFDALPLSSVKIQAINEHYGLRPGDSKLSYIFNILKYHDVWKQLNDFGFRKTDSSTEAEIYQGFLSENTIYKPTKEQKEFTGWENTGTKKTDLPELGFLYTKRIIELCKNNNIDIVLYAAPECKWKEENYNAVKAFADSVEVPYIDFHIQEVWQKSGFDFSKDMQDETHTNTLGAIKITRYLGKYLHEHYDIPDRRGDPKYKGLEADYARWERELYTESFVFENDMSRYLDKILDKETKDYTVIISVKDDCQTAMGGGIKVRLKQMGFKSDKVFDDKEHSFIGIWQNGKVAYERCSKTKNDKEKDLLEYKSILPDKTKFYVKSGGYRCGNVSSIIIDGKEYSKNSRGFNVVVYDNKTHRVVDSICWDTGKDAGVTYKR